MSNADEDRLFQAALEYQTALQTGRPPDRTAFLARYADLAEDLVPYLDALDALHASPLHPPHEAPEADLAANTPLGDFQIVREIGRGGMGVVYEAIQLSLRRRVALKVLPFAAALDPRHLQRFKTEAQAAACLHHEHIVPVYAVGCERGVHFYAMQLIDGRSLAELIVAMREGMHQTAPATAETAARADTAVSPSLGAGTEYHRHAACLMLQAARALEHAHQMDIIHRDIKPANLLLDVRGHLWVTDFGLAQFQTGLDLTRTGDLVGTLRYMSPEQASGQRQPADHRADVYSLGATFYELFTLGPLFPAASRAELLQQILQDDPVPLRSLRRDVPPELETIILKCLSKVPSDRYASALDLAEDLERFLANRPIHARRPTLVERVRKWSRRHPSLVAATLIVLLLSTTGLLVSNALVAREEARTRDALLREQHRAEQAERRLHQNRQLVDLLIRLGEEDLDAGAPTRGLRKRLLEIALSHYQRLADDCRDDPGSAAELAAAVERAREILAGLVAFQQVDDALLLGNPAILDELDPSDEQRQQVRQLTRQLFQQRLTAFADQGLTPAEKRRRERQQARAAEQAVADILTAQQRLRLRQVALQLKGMMAFREPEIIETLRLSADQRQRMREIEQESFRPPPPPEPGKGGGFQRSFFSRFRDGMERCVALLSPTQKAKWQEMTGAPFTLPMPPFPPRGFVPPPHRSPEDHNHPKE